MFPAVRREGSGAQEAAQRAGLQGAVWYLHGAAFRWALAASRRHPPRPPPAPDFHPRICTFNGTSVVTFNPAPGTFMPARQNFI